MSFYNKNLANVIKIKENERHFRVKLLSLQINRMYMRKNSHATAYRDALRLKLLETAMPLFKRNGVKSVRMDDIAAELQISKRTLYEIYSNKEDLLFECVKHDADTFQTLLNEYAKTTNNEMDVIAFFLKNKLKDFDKTNPIFFTEIHKYSKIVSYLTASHESQREKSLTFFTNGINHGFFRNDINYEIVHKMLDAATNHIMQSEMYKKYSLKEIFHTLILIYMRACCTEKGMAYIDRFLNEKEPTE